MDAKIDEMIAKGIEPADIIIHGKADVGQIPVPGPSIQGRGFDAIPGEIRHAHGVIVDDESVIIEQEGTVEGVGIDNDADANKNDQKE